MTSRLQTKTIIEPTLADAMVILKQDIFASINAVKVGHIQTFDGAKKTAQVQILFKRVLPDGTLQDYPVLVDVPVFTLQGGGGSLQFPIAAGDQCILLFADRNLDAWFKNGVAAAPFDGRCHDLSDGIALVGLNSLASSLASSPTGKAVLAFGATELDMAANVITLKNATTTLLTLLNGLIDVIAAATVQTSGTPPLTAATIAALQAYKLQLAVLLG